MGTCLAAKLSPIRVATSYNTAYQQGFQHLHTSSSLGGQEQSVNCPALLMPQANLRQPKEGPTRKDDIRASGVGSTADARATFCEILPPPPPPPQLQDTPQSISGDRQCQSPPRRSQPGGAKGASLSVSGHKNLGFITITDNNGTNDI